ncbi:2-oxo-4-hydroxy-4-carboxy-5-ureidoimidazoline decarboxylase [Mesopusillimonas faecipullorum]|nr:2-oxo-4-hydroxy-4-carboxy-5-ureidoimidazoline decarboxylase [Mesopusillimonas faecipullorum]
MMAPISLDALNKIPPQDFVEVLGGVFEHSPWVAQGVVELRPFQSVQALHQAMVACIADAGHKAQLSLMRAHPELAGKAAVKGELTADSASEQTGAGLDQCTPQEFAHLTALNQAYREKFGFPFIIAVRGLDRSRIIQAFERRLSRDYDEEFAECLTQIYTIGELRLQAILTT